jgi:hypothetical protein
VPSVGIMDDLMDSASSRYIVMYGAKGRCFFHPEGSFIVSFFDCTQVSSRNKHRKAGMNRIQEAFLMA